VEPSFSTFFHINQRGEDGYRDLARLVAMSEPLTLWAPSSVLLAAPSCGVEPKQFLDFLEEGHIRVMGRRAWLGEPGARNSDRWPGTAWDSQIDGPIWNLAQADEGKPLAERRVVIACEEKGYEWADEYLSEHPQESMKWYKRASARGASRTIPGGTLQAVRRLGGDRVKVARRILRDAYNHGRALAESGARVPILQSFTHRKFVEVLAQAPPLEGGAGVPPTSVPRSGTAPQMEGLSAMTGELARLLAELDLHGAPEPKRLRRFLRGPGHRHLVAWMSGICTEYEQHRPQAVDEFVFDRLEQELGRASFESFMQGLRRHPDDAGIGAVGAVAGVVGMATAGAGWVPALALGAAVYPVGKGLVRELGFIPAAFDGPQWPFLYTYGRAARKGQLESMRAALEQMQADANQSKSATP
jgi:hypothetical protein